MTQASPEDFEKLVGHKFSDLSLLKTALTHSSTGKGSNYERLEFLGDRVLGLIVAEFLYKKFPEEPEGDLAKRLAVLVQGSLLAKIAQTIPLGNYIHFSESERESGGAQNENILADVFESTLGAMYLDGGLSICRNWITKMWHDDFFAMKEPPQHPKTSLQEWAQGKNLGLPDYKITDQSGPDHAPIFDITLSVEGYDKVIAQGRSRQEAEKAAATLFIEKHINDLS